MLKLLFFILATAGFVWLSYPSLRQLRSHGFYRCFAFELILILILLNVNVWFISPFSWRQIVSWILLSVSGFLAIHGFYLLKVIGRPQGKKDNSPNLGFENTANLVVVGAYQYIRHPLYASLLFLGWGVFFKNPHFIACILALAMSFSCLPPPKLKSRRICAPSAMNTLNT